MDATFVIIGGDAAGLSAASKAKRDAPELDVIVLEQGDWVSYGACGLPYYVKGAVDSLDDLVSVPAESFRTDRDIDLRTNHRAIGLDVDARTVTVETEDGRYEQAYDDLLIATGARAVEPPIEGLDLDGVFTLRDLDDGAVLRSFLEGPGLGSAREGYGAESGSYPAGPHRIGIVGGGYVGIEMAEAFDARGLEVLLFEMLPHTLQPFGSEAAREVEQHLRDRGIQLSLDTAVERLEGEGRVTGIRTAAERVPVDAVLVGAGVAPNAELAASAGIELGPTGAIATDAYGRTSADHVYAAGDCAEARHAVTGDPVHVPLALTANRHGRAIGRTVAGTPTEGGAVLGTAALKAFDLEVARTGVIDEERARDAGFDPVAVTITAPSRAHYYPGGSEITVRLVADRGSGRVLGTSMVGEEGVAKRIDTVAAAIHAEQTVSDVERFDLTYAPPFGPVWDPVLTAAKVLSGRLERPEPVRASG